MEREVGGGIGMVNTCKPMAVSFQCMSKSTTIKKKEGGDIYIYTYGWFVLMSDRKQQNSVKQNKQNFKNISTVKKVMASSPITSCQIDGEKNANSDRLYFLGLQNQCRW